MALTLYHATPSRSTGVRILLEELRAPYELKVINLKKGEENSPEFRAINPMGKVPTIVHHGAVVTEQVAIYTYLADAFPEAGLAPPIVDPLRGPYLRWMAFYGSSFEPAVVDKALQREAPPYSMSPYGGFDTVMAAISQQLAEGPWFLGQKFTALDILWGASLGWMIQFEIIPVSRSIQRFVAAVNARPSVQKIRDDDARISAEQLAKG